MESKFVQNLTEHMDLLESIFNINKNQAMMVLANLSGNEDDMLSQFFINLNIPLNHQTFKIVQSIAQKQ